MKRLEDLAKRAVGPKRRRQIALARVRIRSLTSDWRRLPDFLVIGAQRSGTSSLYKYLSAHPGVVPSVRKEVEYFSRYYSHGDRWFRAHFPLRARSCQTFEATPDYLLHPLAPARAKSDVPDARFVVILREPVARAFSHYQHEVRLGFERLSFERALELEQERIMPDLDRLQEDPLYPPRHLYFFSYVTRGLYAQQLARWFNQFPRERFLVIFSENFFADTARTYEQILRFLGLPEHRLRTFANYSSRSSADLSSIDDRTRRRLVDTFEPANRDLENLLGVPTPWTIRAPT